MRPQGEYRMALAAALAFGPATSREAAARACMSVNDARVTLDNMCRAEHATKLAPVRVEGVKRPVPVYALAASVGDDAQPQAPPGEPFADAQFPPIYWWVDGLTE